MFFKNYLLKLEGLNNQKNRELICVYGCSQIVQLIYQDIKNNCKMETIKIVQKALNAPYITFYCWISGKNPIPISKVYGLLRLWKKICYKTNEEVSDKFNEVYLHSSGFSQNGQRKVALPKEMNESLGYLIGFFQGDGHLKKDNKQGFQEHSIYFYEADKRMLEEINDILYYEFNVRGRIYHQSNETGSWHTLRLSSKPVYLFFRYVLGLEAGRKTGYIKVPKLIKEANNIVQFAFIRGFFDAEGGVGETNKNPWLEIGQASNNYPAEVLFWIRNKLVEQGIELTKPQKVTNQSFFRLRTSKRDTIKKFFSIISSSHPKKLNKFEGIVER